MTAAPYYQDDAVTLYLGRWQDVAEQLTADVLVTDPPYGIGWKQGGYPGSGRTRGGSPHPGIAGDADTAERDACLAWWGDRPWIAFGSWRAPAPAGAHHRLTFVKYAGAGVIGSTIGYRRDTEDVYLGGPWPRRPAAWSSVIRTAHGLNHAPGIHPHGKPLDVLVQLIERAPPGVILDPFAGSGSTLIAARILGRRAVGVELEERYAADAATRLAQQTVRW